MLIVHERVQHAAGQGFFHSASIDVEGVDRMFRYVYDCGSSAGAAVRDDEIRTYKREVSAAGGLVDVIFLSHAHEDHINGLPKLFGRDKKTTLRAGVLVIPYLDTVARLIALGSCLGSSRGTFLESFMVRGVDALLDELRIDHVIEVYSGRQGDGDFAPPSGVDDSSPYDLILVDSILEFGTPSTSAVVGRPSNARTVSDQDSFVVNYVGIPIWQLRVQVDPSERARRAGFVERLTEQLEAELVGDVTLTEWLSDEANVSSLLRKHRKKLAAAYGNSNDLNATSLSLYSGPMDGSTGAAHAHPHPPTTRCPACDSCRVGWLGTGDARLVENLDDFVEHFRNQLPEVMTLALPHHGSRENSDSRLFERVMPLFAIAACSIRGNYGHPHSETVHRVANAGARFVIVNENPASKFIESQTLNWDSGRYSIQESLVRGPGPYSNVEHERYPTP